MGCLTNIICHKNFFLGFFYFSSCHSIYRIYLLVILGRDGYFTGALVYSNVDDNIHFDILHWNNLLILQLSPIFTLANVGLIVYLKLFVTLGILVTIHS